MSHIVPEKDIEAEIMELEDACSRPRTHSIGALNLSPELLEKVLLINDNLGHCVG